MDTKDPKAITCMSDDENRAGDNVYRYFDAIILFWEELSFLSCLEILCIWKQQKLQ